MVPVRNISDPRVVMAMLKRKQRDSKLRNRKEVEKKMHGMFFSLQFSRETLMGRFVCRCVRRPAYSLATVSKAGGHWRRRVQLCPTHRCGYTATATRKKNCSRSYIAVVYVLYWEFHEPHKQQQTRSDRH